MDGEAVPSISTAFAITSHFSLNPFFFSFFHVMLMFLCRVFYRRGDKRIAYFTIKETLVFYSMNELNPVVLLWCTSNFWKHVGTRYTTTRYVLLKPAKKIPVRLRSMASNNKL